MKQKEIFEEIGEIVDEQITPLLDKLPQNNSRVHLMFLMGYVCHNDQIEGMFHTRSSAEMLSELLRGWLMSDPNISQDIMLNILSDMGGNDMAQNN